MTPFRRPWTSCTDAGLLPALGKYFKPSTPPAPNITNSLRLATASRSQRILSYSGWSAAVLTVPPLSSTNAHSIFAADSCGRRSQNKRLSHCVHGVIPQRTHPPHPPPNTHHHTHHTPCTANNHIPQKIPLHETYLAQSPMYMLNNTCGMHHFSCLDYDGRSCLKQRGPK
jgi:hypothetical protein